MGSLRVGHDWATSLSLFTFMHRRRKWQPTPLFLPGESQGRRSLVGYRLWGRTELDTRTQLKWLSRSSSREETKLNFPQGWPVQGHRVQKWWSWDQKIQSTDPQSDTFSFVWHCSPLLEAWRQTLRTHSVCQEEASTNSPETFSLKVCLFWMSVNPYPYLTGDTIWLKACF